MIAVPSIAMLLLLAIMSALAASILRRPWQRNVALGCVVVEVVSAGALIIAVAW